MNQEEWRERENIYACWLCNFPDMGNRQRHRLSELCGGPEAVYLADKKKWGEVLQPKQVESLARYTALWKPQAQYRRMREEGIEVILIGDERYPERLRRIPDAPYCLFVRGELPGADTPAVAIVGSRECSAYGKYVAKVLGEALGKRGVTVISGMARGIDGISQEAALEAGGNSIGVLGSGVDICYPAQNRPIYERLIRTGAVISTYPLGTPALPRNFPPRNRIVSGLADAVVVVEARAKSGTLITVDMALEQGREVYTIPGRCTDSLSMGCNRLLRQGAMVATAPEDIIEDQRWESFLTKTPDNKAPAKASAVKLSPAAQEVYSALDMLPSTQDEIVTKLRAQKSICTIPQICQGLVELELKGLAACQNGQYQRRCVF